jgi:LytS/YehU family sensor histidine kinase
MEAKELVFKSRNKILVRNSAIKNEGIGLANIQRRLQLLYPGRHSLSIDATEDYFEVILKLNPDEN